MDERKYVDGLDWRSYAACVGHDPDLWFPVEPRNDVVPIMICMSCPVRPDCLAYAKKTRQRHGIWGGRWMGRKDQAHGPEGLAGAYLW